jgi:hypothetical protein
VIEEQLALPGTSWVDDSDPQAAMTEVLGLPPRIYIRRPTIEEFDDVRKPFDEAGDTSELLGGPWLPSYIKDRIRAPRPSFWSAYTGYAVVGGIGMGGRDIPHLCKYDQIAVLRRYRRMKIATSLYFALTIQGILEGRRLFETVFAQGNPYQPHLQESLGLSQAAVLRHRTSHARDLYIFQGSLLDQGLAGLGAARHGEARHGMSWHGFFETMMNRVPPEVQVEIYTNSLVEAYWEKNLETYKRFIPDAVSILHQLREIITQLPWIHITQEDR